MIGKVFWKRGLLLLTFLLVILAVTAMPAFADSLPPGFPTGVTLNQSSLTLAVGATATLTASPCHPC